MRHTAVNSPPRRIKAVFLGPFALMLVVFMAAFVVAIYLMQFRVLQRELGERATAVGQLFSQKLAKDTGLMRAAVHAMMANPLMEQAFRTRNREGLARVAGPMFESLNSQDRITHLYFTGSDLVTVLRLHDPSLYGDAINRATTLRARETGENVHGLELGPLGTLTLRLVMPWRRGETIIGFVEIGKEIEHLLDEIRDSLSVDVVALVDKRFLSPEQWQRGMALLGRGGRWDRFPDLIAIAQTIEKLPDGLSAPVLDRLRAGETSEFKDGGRNLHLVMLPVKDASGRHIGGLVVIRDITSLHVAFYRSMAAVILICLVASTAVFGLFDFSLDRVERDYRRQHDTELQLLRLSTEHQRIVQLEKLSAMGTLVGEIAHQLNNPLVGVMNLAQLAQREADDPIRTRELLGEIRRAGEDCRSFVQRMLQFSKVSCFDHKLTLMGPLVEETVLLFRQSAGRTFPVEIRLPDRPVELDIDPILVRHALFNLLANAGQASEGGGAIVIALEPAADPESGAAGWSLSVTDHGHGIADDIADKLFVPFFTTRSDGTGLGLPVVQHVALLHGGHVTFANTDEGGACFALWLPGKDNNDPRGHGA